VSPGDKMLFVVGKKKRSGRRDGAGEEERSVSEGGAGRTEPQG